MRSVQKSFLTPIFTPKPRFGRSWRSRVCLLICFFATLTLFACSKTITPFSQIMPGKTTEAQLKKVYGLPKKIEKSATNNNVQFYQYDENRFQVEQNWITAKSRIPKNNETRIQFWRQKYKDFDQKVNPIAQFKGTEKPDRAQLIIPEFKFSIIFNIETGKVEEVIEYGAPT